MSFLGAALLFKLPLLCSLRVHERIQGTFKATRSSVVARARSIRGRDTAARHRMMNIGGQVAHAGERIRVWGATTGNEASNVRQLGELTFVGFPGQAILSAPMHAWSAQLPARTLLWSVRTSAPLRWSARVATAPFRWVHARVLDIAGRDDSTSQSCSFRDPVKLFDAKATGERSLTPSLSSGTLLDRTFGASVPHLVGVLFTERSPFTKTFMERVGRSNTTVGEWACDGTTCMRTVSYVGRKTALVPEHEASEEQHMTRLPSGDCVVSVRTSTSRVPFGDQFTIVVQYALSESPMGNPEPPSKSTKKSVRNATKAIDERAVPSEDTTRLVVSWALEWRRRPPVVGAMVRSGARNGLQANFDAFADVLASHATTRSKRRR